MIDLSPETILRARDGDEGASREIVEALHRPVLGIIHRFLGPAFRKDVEDIAQDVFLKVFRALDRYDPTRAKFTTWVYTFVRNHCFDVMKRRRLPTTSVYADQDGERDRELVDDRELGSLRSAANSELGSKIAQALGQLGEDQRMAFILREYEGMDYESIGRITGVSEGTVKSRLHRAKESLRTKLRPYLQAGESS
jgi:RNA polymerase sigma-70 factor (ECF subfamily)